MDADVLVGPRFTSRPEQRRKESATGPGCRCRHRQDRGRRAAAGHPGGQHLPPRGFHRRVRRCGDGAAAARDPSPGRGTAPRRMGVTRPQPAPSPGSSGLAGATIGFVGFGHIGARTWELFRAFGARGVTVTGRGNVDAAAKGLEWSGNRRRYRQAAGDLRCGRGVRTTHPGDHRSDRRGRAGQDAPLRAAGQRRPRTRSSTTGALHRAERLAPSAAPPSTSGTTTRPRETPAHHPPFPSTN